MPKYQDTDYLAISTRIHAMENRLLTRERMERMIDAGEDHEAAKVLYECGYGELTKIAPTELERLLSAARAGIFHELEEAVPEKALVQVFQLKYDYHNAKVLIKAGASGIDAGRLLLSGGRYDPDALAEDFTRDELRGVSPAFQAAVTRAKETLAASGDPQVADFLLDKAYFEEMSRLAEDADSGFLKGYVRLLIDAANLRSAVRAARLEKESEFLKLALVPGGNVSERQIASAGAEELAGLFQSGALHEAAALVSGLARPDGGALTEFERLCDDAVTGYLASAKRIPFGQEAVIGYLYARETEITAVRTIMSGRMAGLSGELIRSRLRDTYI